MSARPGEEPGARRDVGVKFPSAIIARARITSGTGALGTQAQDITSGGTVDLVVMDDFVYSEPVPQ